ncbi:MAG: hypothetical protein R2766_09790 [Saprospiraceae bacterium]
MKLIVDEENEVEIIIDTTKMLLNPFSVVFDADIFLVYRKVILIVSQILLSRFYP